METIGVQLSELFHSIQGEGPAMGRPSIFIRMSKCNRSCKGCDTAIKDKVEETNTMTIINRVQNYLKTYPNCRIVFTGGEPMLQSNAISAIIDGLPGLQYDIETNGTLKDTVNKDFFSRFNLLVVSPKKDCFNSPKDRIQFFEDWDKISKEGRNNVFLKIVVGNLPWMFAESEVKDTLEYSKFDPQRVWLMPGGDSASNLVIPAKNVWKVALRLGCNYSDRLHIRTNSK
jgi:7-carboxy-7-deazaguanine synthase